jgi:hypothetical protein
MNFIVPEYWNSWLLPITEAFIIPCCAKHCFCKLHPLKEKMNRKWLQTETIFIMSILLVTGFMGQSVPPQAKAQQRKESKYWASREKL